MSLSMDKYLTLGSVLGIIAASHGGSFPKMPWNDKDASMMCRISTDYYNKMSGESALYRLHGNDTECRMNEVSSFHQLHFTIKETLCQQPEHEVTDDCTFKEDGLVKSCVASFMVEDDQDVMLVKCDNVTQQRSRVSRPRNNGRGSWNCNGFRNRGNNGRTNRGNNRDRTRPLPGARSPISKNDVIGNI